MRARRANSGVGLWRCSARCGRRNCSPASSILQCGGDRVPEGCGTKHLKTGPAGPGAPPGAPRTLQDGSKGFPDGPQDGPRWPGTPPTGRQDGPQTAQQGPKTAPREPRDGPRWPPSARQSIPNGHMIVQGDRGWQQGGPKKPPLVPASSVYDIGGPPTVPVDRLLATGSFLGAAFLGPC